MPQRGVLMRTFVRGSLVACVVALAPSVAAALPDGRRYELVTPVQKNAADVLASPKRTRAAASGDAIQYASLTGFADVHGGSRATEYMAIRDANGIWRTHGITPIQEPGSFIPDATVFEARYMGEFSSDLSHGVFMAKTPLTDAPNVAQAINLYLRDDLLSPGLGDYTLLTNAVTDQGDVYDPSIQPAVAGASADFSHVLFESPRVLLPEASGLNPGQSKLYEWVNGSLRFAGMVPAAPDEECGAAGPACVPSVSEAGQGALALAYTLTTISQDGRRIIFTVPGGGPQQGQLYLRDDQGTATLTDDVTMHVNASDAPQDARFWAASSDGTKVFFTTAEPLVDEDPNSSNDLYRFDLNAPQDSRLTRVSIDSEPDDNIGNDLANGHDVAGAIGASADGATVYFIAGDSAGSQLIDGGSIVQPVGNANAPGSARIYRWHLGELHEVGGINAGASPEAERLIGQGGWGLTPKWSRVSPDGRHLAFITQGTDQLLSHYGKPEANHGDACTSMGTPACLEIYVYDADANGGAGDLQCASCNPVGLPATEDAEFHTSFALGVSLATSHLSHPLSDDGRFVFFNSDDALLPADKNSVTDAYQFNTQTGQVSLLSSGTGTARSIFLDASADGRDAFILTRAQLHSEDHDQSADLYDARIGGTPDPGSSTPRVCEGEDCRPAVTPTVTAGDPASGAFQGPGDRLAPPNPAAFFHAAALTRAQRRHLARTGAARLEVSASQAGTITIRVRARIAGTRRTLQTIRRTLSSPATIHPRIRLSAAARRQLARHHRLRASIVVGYSQTAAPQRLVVTLTR